MANKTKICCIFNLAPHYRAPIFKLMDRQLKCDFYFGDFVGTPIKKIDYNELTGFKKELKNIYIPHTGFEWQKGAWQLIFKPYKHYIITGTPGSLSNWVLLLFAKLLNKKIYAWSHGMKGSNTPAGRIIEVNFYRLCYKVLLYGDFAKNIMENAGFSENKLIPIYNSLDYDNQLSIRKNLKPNNIYLNHFGNSNPVLIYIGRIQKRKKLELLISAINDLNKEKKPCNLVIVGPDEENNDIPKLIENLNLKDKVWMYGPCYDETKSAELLFNAHACVTPGPVGLTALHALTYGCPVISNNDFDTQMPEYESVTPKETGSFFELDNLESLKEHINYWISKELSQRNDVRKYAYKIIDEKYNPHYQIDILKKLMQK